MEAERHQTGKERFGERFDFSGQLCQSSFSPREKILSVCGSRGWAVLPGLTAAWHSPALGHSSCLCFSFLSIFGIAWLTVSHQLVVLFPSCIFSGVRPHPWSSLEPSSSPSSPCCEFSKRCSRGFSPNLLFQACALMANSNIFLHCYQHIPKGACMAKCRQPQEGTQG